jgi:lactate dehydrogenase-like 2-hydroxyacid dehydrogenase
MSDPSAPAVLVLQPMLAARREPMEARGFRVIGGWDAPAEDLAQVRAIFHYGPLETEKLAQLPRLGLIALLTAGYDGIDLDWCRQHGVAVTHARGVNAGDVADHAMGLLLAAWRGTLASDRFVREGEWGKTRRPPLRSLNGRKLGVVGLGHIGVAVARRAEPFGLQVSWWGPREKPAQWPRAESLEALARDSDILMVACRADETNAGLISREVIEALGPEGLLVNVARGSVVDEEALIAALKSGALGFAALDVFEQEPTPAERWAGVDNVLLTPHEAGGSVETVPRMVDLALENIRLFLAGEPLTAEIPEFASRP